MKKRILSCLLVLAMILPMVPAFSVGVAATDTTGWTNCGQSVPSDTLHTFHLLSSGLSLIVSGVNQRSPLFICDNTANMKVYGYNVGPTILCSSSAAKLTGYYIATGYDNTVDLNRLTGWTIYGSADGVDYTIIDKVTDAVGLLDSLTFSNSTWYKKTLPEETEAYNYVKVEFEGTVTQIGDFQLIGSVVASEHKEYEVISLMDYDVTVEQSVSLYFNEFVAKYDAFLPSLQATVGNAAGIKVAIDLIRTGRVEYSVVAIDENMDEIATTSLAEEITFRLPLPSGMYLPDQQVVICDPGDGASVLTEVIGNDEHPFVEYTTDKLGNIIVFDGTGFDAIGVADRRSATAQYAGFLSIVSANYTSRILYPLQSFGQTTKPTDLYSGAYTFISGPTTGHGTYEGPENLFDNNQGTKLYQTYQTSQNLVPIVWSTENAITPAGIWIETANDNKTSGRMPTGLNLYASTDGSEWTELELNFNEVNLVAANFTWYYFAICSAAKTENGKPVKYSYFKISIPRTSFQLSEVALTEIQAEIIRGDKVTAFSRYEDAAEYAIAGDTVNTWIASDVNDFASDVTINCYFENRNYKYDVERVNYVTDDVLSTETKSLWREEEDELLTEAEAELISGYSQFDIVQTDAKTGLVRVYYLPQDSVYATVNGCNSYVMANQCVLPLSVDFSALTLYSAFAGTLSGDSSNVINLSAGAQTVCDLTTLFTDGLVDGKTLTLTLTDGKVLKITFAKTDLKELHIDLADDNLSAINKSKSVTGSGTAYYVCVDGTVVADIEIKQIKGRGNSSWSLAGDKKSYNIKTNSSTIIDRNTNSNKTYSLLACNVNASASHSKVALPNVAGLALFEELDGDGAVCYEVVDLYIDDEYRGVYVLTNKVNEKQVGITAEDYEGDDAATLKKVTSLNATTQTEQSILALGVQEFRYCTNNTATEGGFLVEYDQWYGMNEPAYFVTNLGRTVAVKSPEYPSAEQMLTIATMVQKFEDALVSSTGLNSENLGIDAYVDIESLAKFDLAQRLSGNSDYFISSTYFYTDGTGKLKAGPLWDTDFGALVSSPGPYYGSCVTYDKYFKTNGALQAAESLIRSSAEYATALATVQQILTDTRDAMLDSEVQNEALWNNNFVEDSAKFIFNFNKQVDGFDSFFTGKLDGLAIDRETNGDLTYTLTGSGSVTWYRKDRSGTETLTSDVTITPEEGYIYYAVAEGKMIGSNSVVTMASNAIFVGSVIAKHDGAWYAYDTIEEALADATSEGDVIQLLEDIASIDDLTVPAGVTLDLNGHDVTATYGATVNGTIIDTAAEKGIVSAPAWSIADGTGSYTPIYNATGYSFYNLALNAKEVDTGSDDTAAVVFSLKKTGDYAADRLAAFDLMDDGAANSRVKATVTVTWVNGTEKSETFTVTDEMMAQYCNKTTPMALKITLSGLTAVTGPVTVTVGFTSYNDSDVAIATLGSTAFTVKN